MPFKGLEEKFTIANMNEVCEAYYSLYPKVVILSRLKFQWNFYFHLLSIS